MRKNPNMQDVGKQVITVLQNSDNRIQERVPKKLLNYLTELASMSTIQVNLDLDKDIEKQNIYEESKDLLAYIYYSYICDEDEKIDISKKWNENEHEYQKKLREKYNPENMYINNIKETEVCDKNIEQSLVQLENEKWYVRIFKKIKNIFRR